MKRLEVAAAGDSFRRWSTLQRTLTEVIKDEEEAVGRRSAAWVLLKIVAPHRAAAAQRVHRAILANAVDEHPVDVDVDVPA